MSSAHCTHHHQVLPRNQFLYLLDLYLDYAKALDFEVRKSSYMRFTNFVIDDFNEKFEGKCTPGSEEVETKKTAKMLYCALMENYEELTIEHCVASAAFWTEKAEADERETPCRRRRRR